MYKEGHPEIEVSSSFDDKKKLLSVTVKQTHKTGDTIASAFSFPVTIALMDADGHEVRHRVEINAREQGFTFAMDKAPKAVRFDPEHDILKTLKHKRGREALEVVLRHAPEAIGRAAAARELGTEGSPQATAALRDAMLTDKFWGVQGDAATALGTIRTTAALDALIEGLKLPHPKARRAVTRALGNFRGDARAASALAEIVAKGDESYFVEAEAVSVARQDARRARVRASDGSAQARLVPGNHTNARASPGWPSCATSAQSTSLATIRRTAGPRALGWLRSARWRDLRRSRRTGAIEILDLMTPLVDDREFMVRMRIPSAFSEVGDPRALPALRRLADRDLDGRIQRHANDAITSISEGRSRIEEGQRLREDIDKLRDDNKKLQERLEKVEARARDKPA